MSELPKAPTTLWSGGDVSELRFGIQLRETASRSEWQDKGRLAEAMGFNTAVVPDHLAINEAGGSLGCLPALQSIADATEELRVGTLVLCNDFRHPLVLAQDAATLDVLSGGRLELGIGAGWMGDDYRVMGITLDAPGVRVERLAEAIDILKLAFAGEEFSYKGKNYTVDKHTGFPSPVQRPHPPILVGGGGPRILKLAATKADIVNIFIPTAADGSGPILSGAAPGRFQERVNLVTETGRNRNLELSVLIQYLEVTNNRMKVAAEHAEWLGITSEEMLDVPLELIGTPQQIANDMRERHERYGLSYLIFFEKDMKSAADIIEKLA